MEPLGEAPTVVPKGLLPNPYSIPVERIGL